MPRRRTAEAYDLKETSGNKYEAKKERKKTDTKGKKNILKNITRRKTEREINKILICNRKQETFMQNINELILKHFALHSNLVHLAGKVDKSESYPLKRRVKLKSKIKNKNKDNRRILRVKKQGSLCYSLFQAKFSGKHEIARKIVLDSLNIARTSKNRTSSRNSERSVQTRTSKRQATGIQKTKQTDCNKEKILKSLDNTHK